MFDIFPGRQCPKLHYMSCTLESDLFACKDFDYLSDIDADGEQTMILEGVVGISVDEAAFADTRLAQKQQFDSVQGESGRGFGADGHYMNCIFKGGCAMKSKQTNMGEIKAINGKLI